MRADIPNVAASMPSVPCELRMATTAAPATKPRIWLAWKVILPTAEPSTNLSPGSTSGMSAVRAEENGAPVSTVQNSRTHSTSKGMGGLSGLPRPLGPPEPAHPGPRAGHARPEARSSAQTPRTGSPLGISQGLMRHMPGFVGEHGRCPPVIQ